ncbi:MAG: HupE/UreJ family protein [Alphaproteobacteria bacterium]
MRNISAVSILAVLLVAANPALAHHAMGGETPDTLLAGFISGLAHPVIGLDHLAFVIAMGLASAFAPRSALAPLAFVAMTVFGCVLFLDGLELPLAEIVITGSVVLLGALVLSGRALPFAAYAALFAIAGLFHGWAYGESIIGAEPTPLVAYLAGFALVQYAIAFAVAWGTKAVWQATSPLALKPRLAGAMMAGIGLAFLVENVEALLFA